MGPRAHEPGSRDREAHQRSGHDGFPGEDKQNQVSEQTEQPIVLQVERKVCPKCRRPAVHCICKSVRKG